MIFNNSKIVGLKEEFRPLERKMSGLGFDRWAWDLHKVVYDKKYSLNGVDYYLRIPGKVVNERYLEHPKALVQFDAPIFARHFFPHGLDNDAEVPEDLKQTIEDQLEEVYRSFSD